MMRIGVCMGLEDLHTQVQGLDYLEPTVQGLLQPLQDHCQALSDVARGPVKPYAANCLIPGSLKTTGPESDLQAVADYMEVTCRRAAQAGLKVLVFGSGGSRGVPEGFDPDQARRQLVEHLKTWAPLATQAGVTIVVEPLSVRECNIITSVDDGADLVRRVGDAHIRLLADTYHMARDGDDPESIVRAGDLIAHVHVAQEEGRRPPLPGGQDFSAYLSRLKAIRYQGGVSIEAKWEDRCAQLPLAVTELRRQIESA
jgi:sugar phosphate isomerase/epimerase